VLQLDQEITEVEHDIACEYRDCPVMPFGGLRWMKELG
jgi:hypothetical protein